MKKLPTFDSLMNPLLSALRYLGGSGSIEEIYEKVIELEDISEDILSKIHNPDKGSQTEVAYRLAWARTYLRKYGLLENSSRGVWALTANAKNIDAVDPQQVVKFVRESDKNAVSTQKGQKSRSKGESSEDALEEAQEWKATLHQVLTKQIDADGFERLTQRLLRESGFVSVEVTGRTGDGGIDGKGIARIHGLMSFHVIFQCKKYQGAVGPGAIRDFRRAMVGRADKGLFITTGTFTPAAIKEATRDVAPPIDLVDGDELADRLKELGLGVKRELVEIITVEEDWFENL